MVFEFLRRLFLPSDERRSQAEAVDALETRFATLAAQNLAMVLERHDPESAGALSERGVMVSGRLVAVRPRVESVTPHEDAWMVGLRFDVSVDGAPEPRYAFGAAGAAPTQKLAYRSAFEVWVEMFAEPFVTARVKPAAGLRVGAYVAHLSPVMVRGQVPDELLQSELGPKTLLATLEPFLPSPPRPGWQTTAELKLYLENDGSVNAECLQDAQPAPGLVERLRRLRIGCTGSAAILKSYVVLVAQEPSLAGR